MPAKGFGRAFHARHPHLEVEGFTETSPADETYNCVAWALGVADRWYQPGGAKGTFWPAGIRADFTLDAYVELFEAVGYERAMEREIEPGMERVAIYAADGDFCHVARQLPAGWTSKCGELQDISHLTLSALEDNAYGRVAVLLQRVRNLPPGE